MAALELNQIPRDAGDVYRYGEPLIESWMGVASKGVSLRQTQVNDPARYAVDAENLDTTGTPSRLSLRAVAGPHSLTVNSNGITLSTVSVTFLATVGTLHSIGGAAFDANVTIGTTLGVSGTSTLGALNAAATSVTTLASSGLYTASAGITVSGGTLTAGTTNLAATSVTTLSSTGLATLNSVSVTTTLGVTGTSTLGALNAAATSVTTLASSGLYTASAGITVAAGVLTAGTTNLGTTTTGGLTAGATSVTTLAASSTSTLTGAVTMVSNLTVGNATGVASGVIRLPNNQFVYSEESGGTDRQILGIDNSNFVRVGDHVSGTASLSVGATTTVYLLGGGNIVLQVTSAPAIGFFAQTPNTRQTVSGSRAGNAALQSLCSALANYGLIVDSTT